MPTTISNEYNTFLDIKSIKNLNSFFARTSEDKLALLVRNNKEEHSSTSYSNNYLVLKCNLDLEVETQPIGKFHILTCISDDLEIKKDFTRICNYIFIDKNEPKSSDEVIALFYSLQNIFSEELSHDTHLLQIGLYGEYIALLKLIIESKTNIFNKWHFNFSSRHDIEIDEKTRIEIKTTTRGERIHRFNHEQISRDNIKIFVISNMIELSEEGTSLFDLSQQILNQFDDYKRKLTIEQLNKRCGLSDYNKGIISNLEDCLQNCKLYEDSNIPKLILEKHNAVTNISYDIDFSLVQDKFFSILP